MYTKNKLLFTLITIIIFLLGCDKDKNPTYSKHSFKEAVSAGISVIETDGQNIWIGLADGLAFTDNGGTSWKFFDRSHGLPAGGISAICINENTIWVSAVYDTIIHGETFQAGGELAYSRDNNWTYIPQPEQIRIYNTTWENFNHQNQDNTISGNCVIALKVQIVI